MTKINQNSFYLAAGQRLTTARLRRNLNISQLAKLSGQQYNTIKSIEEGKPFSGHHFLWMTQQLGITVESIIQSMEGHSNEKTETVEGGSLDDLI